MRQQKSQCRMSSSPRLFDSSMVATHLTGLFNEGKRLPDTCRLSSTLAWKMAPSNSIQTLISKIKLHCRHLSLTHFYKCRTIVLVLRELSGY
jgi:hypothetical protein